MSKNSAFTLAETLIVIGIIGVVAALTLPNLNNSTGDKEKVTRVMKSYSSLTEAFDRAQAIYGPYNEWFNDLNVESFIDPNTQNSMTARKEYLSVMNERLGNRVTEFMRLSKNCGSEGDGCFVGSVKDLRESEGPSGPNLYGVVKGRSYTFITTDGTAVSYRDGVIMVDIDGSKGTSTYGKDVFEFVIRESDGTIYPKCYDWDLSNLMSNLSESASCASTWVINYGNLDYVKCPEILDGDTQTSCN